MMTKNARITPGSPSAVSGKPADRLVKGQPLRAGEAPMRESDTSQALLLGMAAVVKK
jgi:hypothetical protein